MARTKDVVLAPEQKELMEKEYLDFVKPSTYGNKANPSSCNSLYDDVENPELRAIVEKVAATTPYREETSTNEAQSPPNPQKRISGKQRKATLEAVSYTHLNAVLRAHSLQGALAHTKHLSCIVIGQHRLQSLARQLLLKCHFCQSHVLDYFCQLFCQLFEGCTFHCYYFHSNSV